MSSSVIPNPAMRLGEVEPSQVVLEGIADPVEEVGLGVDRQRKGLRSRARCSGGRAQAQPVGGQAHLAGEMLLDAVGW